jgi:hypothetical protein
LNKTARSVGLGMLVSMWAVALAVQTPVNLQFSPKVGERFKYKMTGELLINGEVARISADIDYKVTKVDSDRTFTMTSSQTNMQAVLGGQTINPPDSSNTTVNKATGELLDFQTDAIDGAAWRMMMLKHFVYPPKRVSVGEEWTSSVIADSKRGTVAASSTFKFENLEKVGSRNTAKVKISYQENEGADPASSDGFVWIDISDGSMVRTQTTWTNAPSPQGPVNGKITIERV